MPPDNNSLHPRERRLRENAHFPYIAAPWGALLARKGSFPAYRCTWRISCKDMGEMCDDQQRYGGNGRKTTCRASQKTFISRISLHEISQMQGYGGNVRKRVKPTCLRWGKGGLDQPPNKASMFAMVQGKSGFLSHPLRLSRNAWLGTVPNHAFPQHRCTWRISCKDMGEYTSETKGPPLCLMSHAPIPHTSSKQAR